MTTRGGLGADALAADVAAAVASTVNLLFWPCALLLPAGDSADEAEQQRLRMTLWRLEHAFSQLTSDPRALDEALHDLARLFELVGPQFVAWVDLLETLSQEAERAYGTAAGRGDFKKAQVKAAVLYLVRKSNLDVPKVPAYLEPFLLDVWVEWIIDAIVTVLNSRELWTPAPTQPSLRRRVAAPVVAKTSGFLGWLSDRLTNLAWKLVQLRNPLAPTVRAAADRIDLNVPGALGSAVELLTWADQHRAQVRAFVEVVTIAVEEADAFVALNATDKRRYARDLILAFLEQSGLVELDGGLAERLASWIVDLLIDAVLLVFDKRSHFGHRWLAGPPPSVDLLPSAKGA